MKGTGDCTKVGKRAWGLRTWVSPAAGPDFPALRPLVVISFSEGTTGGGGVKALATLENRARDDDETRDMTREHSLEPTARIEPDDE